MNAPILGFFNLGGAEILLLLFLLVIVPAGVIALVLLVVWSQNRRNKPPQPVPPIYPPEATSATLRTCPKCGSRLPTNTPEGLCPRCVLGVGLATHTEDASEAGPQGTKVIQPPPAPDEVARHFPQLEILECLGRGGMGVVYKARQPKLNRLVALKLLAPEKGANPRFAERFLREAQALARLNHPNIVTVHDFGETDGHYYLLMEYVEGVTLRQLLHGQKIAPEEALKIVPSICDALQFAHKLGIVHRDIKPENVLLDKEGRVKIADFGIAKLVGAEAPPLGLTEERSIIGTPHYMAPEQVERPQLVDHRADIYSLGVVFYEMLTGELPLGKFQPPSRKVQVDVRLDEVVLHALEKEPERRYQHASEVKTALETIAAGPGAPTPAGAAGQPVRLLRWRDAWMWNWEYIQLFLIVPIAVAGLALPFGLKFWGLKALWLFTLELPGIAFAATYALVGRRVQKAKAALPRTDREVAECLMFRRPFQALGLAVMHEDRLDLIPVVGSPIVVPLADITAVKEVKWFNGTRLWLKKGFVMDLANGQRVGVAVAEVFARRWRAKLSRGTLPEIPEDAVETKATTGSGKPAGWVTGVRWAARILGTLLFAIYMLFVLGEGLPPMGSQPGNVQFNFIALGLMLLGFMVGWKREGTAALLIASGWTLWHILEGHVRLNAFQTPLPVAVLYGLYWWETQGRRTMVAVATVAALGAALGLGQFFCPTSVFVVGIVSDGAGSPIAGAALTLQDEARSRSGRDKGPNTRTGAHGRFSLYVGWYWAGRQLRIAAPGYETLTTELGPRPLGERLMSRDFHLVKANAAGPAAPAFGPVTERVLYSVAVQRPVKAEDLDKGLEMEVPAELEKAGEDKFFHWLASNGADLLAFAHKRSWSLWAAPKLAAVPAKMWAEPAIPELQSALKTGVVGLGRAEPDTKEGFASYTLSTNPVLPLTFAFQTSAGGLGVLQIAGLAESPRGLKIRYKLAQDAVAPPATSAVAQPLSFGPVLERVVYETTTGRECFLDLETGRLLQPPPRVLSLFAATNWQNHYMHEPEATDPMRAWVWTSGADLVYGAPAFDHERGLILLDGDMIGIEDYWEMEPRQVAERLRAILPTGRVPGTPSLVGDPPSVRDDQLPGSGAFTTKDGTLGVLQVVGFTDNPHGVRIRYKLVIESPLTAPASQRTIIPPEFGPAIERELGGWPGLDVTVLDLDQGRLLTVPTNIVAASMNNPRPMLNWMMEHGADLTVTTGVGANLHLDDGVLLRLVVKSASFDNVTASTIRRHIGRGGGAQDVSVSEADLKAQPVYLYRTGEGGAGVLQVLGLGHDSHNLKIRFKAVREGAR